MPLAFAARPAEITCSLSLSIAHFSFLTRFIIIFKACVAQTKSPTSRWSRSSPVLNLENLPALFFIVNDRRMERLDGTRRRPSPRRLQPTHARRLLSRCFLFVTSPRALHFAVGCPCPVPSAPSAWHWDGDRDRAVTNLSGGSGTWPGLAWPRLWAGAEAGASADGVFTAGFKQVLRFTDLQPQSRIPRGSHILT